MIEVRPFQDDDWPALWRVLEPVFRAGETYPYPPDLSAQEARRLWIDVPQTTYLAVEPAGAAALAALAGPLKERLAGQTVGLIVCGANIDPSTFASHLADAAARAA